jgi:hypothetical protein
MQAREISPLTSRDEQFTPTQLVVLPRACPQRHSRPQNRPTWLAPSPAQR